MTDTATPARHPRGTTESNDPADVWVVLGPDGYQNGRQILRVCPTEAMARAYIAALPWRIETVQSGGSWRSEMTEMCTYYPNTPPQPHTAREERYVHVNTWTPAHPFYTVHLGEWQVSGGVFRDMADAEAFVARDQRDEAPYEIERWQVST